MIENSYLLRHIYKPITYKNFILEDKQILQIKCFFQKIRIFYKFFETELTLPI